MNLRCTKVTQSLGPALPLRLFVFTEQLIISCCHQTTAIARHFTPTPEFEVASLRMEGSIIQFPALKGAEFFIRPLAFLSEKLLK